MVNGCRIFLSNINYPTKNCRIVPTMDYRQWAMDSNNY